MMDNGCFQSVYFLNFALNSVYYWHLFDVKGITMKPLKYDLCFSSSSKIEFLCLKSVESTL